MLSVTLMTIFLFFQNTKLFSKECYRTFRMITLILVLYEKNEIFPYSVE